jgi:cobalt transporter subunit CbtA
MIGRVLLAALLAGIAAGLIMASIQHVRLTPLILEAEQYETMGHTHGEGEATAEHSHDDEGWMPADGWQRTLATTATAMMTGAGFAIVLAGVILLAGASINRRNGAIWGLCGFLAVSLAPSAGLPPELPGMPAGDLIARQIWWLATLSAPGLGLYLIAFRKEGWAIMTAAVLIALPHVFGAPAAATHETAVPAGLAAAFASNAIAANAVMWAFIGLFLGLALEKLVKEPVPA